MDPNDFGGIAEFWDALRPYWDMLWMGLVLFWGALVELQKSNPQLFSLQSLFGLIGTTVAIWKWWEAREKNLFQKFEAMIERDEARLVKARNDLLDVMARPGPGLRIRPPLFAEKALRLVLMRRRWHPSSVLRFGDKIDRRLQRAIETSGRKVDAHRLRLSFYVQEIAAARLVQGAVAAGRAVQTHGLAERQRLEQQALEQFRAALALPGHEDDATALELVPTSSLKWMRCRPPRSMPTRRR
jgi:hypothetical protein